MTDDTLVRVESHIVRPVSLVEPDMAVRLVEYGRRKRWNFRLLPYQGILDCKVGNDEWTYEPYTNQPLHPEAENRLFDVGMQPWVRIEQVVYGHEVELTEEQRLERIRQRATTVLNAIRAFTEDFIQGMFVLDPSLIVVCQGRWIELCRWYGKLER